METVAQYAARIRSYVEGKEPLAVQRQTPILLARMIEGVPEAKLKARPQPDRWSAAEVLAHLAEAELVATWRYRHMLEHDGQPLSAYDQNLWHRLGDYASRNPQDSLQQFRLLRQANLEMFERLTPQEWERHGIHVERGRMTVADLVQQIAGHDLNHLEQIKKVLA